MTSRHDSAPATDRPTIKLAQHAAEQEEARIARTIIHLANELGIDPGKVQVNITRGKSKGQAQVEVSIPPELQDQVIRRLGIKPFNPEKDSVTIGGIEVTLDIQEQGNPWTNAESKRRSKPKSGKPGLPGQ
jgi:hypothetical protein